MNMEPRKFREDQVSFGLWFGFFFGGGAVMASRLPLENHCHIY